MQRRWVRRLSPRVLVVALCSVAMVVTAVAVSQAGPRADRAVSVAMLSGGDAASLPGADTALPGPTAAPEAAPESPPPTEPSSTSTTGAKSAATAARATVVAKPRPNPCPTNGAPDRPCGPPCPQPGSANSATACPPPCAQPAAAPAEAAPSASDGTVVEPARPACPPPPAPPPPTCRQYDIRTGSSQPCPPPCPPSDTAGSSSSPCPQPCPALATADGKPAPCPPPCAHPTEPDGGIGVSQSQLMISCPPPCYDTPNSAGTSCPPPPCEGDASCPEPCYDAQPAPAATTTVAEPARPSEPCPPPPPPPCPSATATDQSCTPPCSYESASGGPAAGAFAPCASGVTGRVTAGPTCPVEQPDEPCPDKPVETTLRLLRKDGSVAATGKSAPDGTFRLAAAPGSYRLVADWPSQVGGCSPVEVTVEYGRFTYADVSCDTGIR